MLARTVLEGLASVTHSDYHWRGELDWAESEFGCAAQLRSDPERVKKQPEGPIA